MAEFSTGVVEQGGQDLVLMPNPTNGELLVQLPEQGHDGGTIRILAMDGRAVLELRSNDNRTLLDLSGLGAGPYLLEWTSAGGTRLVKPFVRH
ncbi:MAG: T9SS type A sorting domain-containing protein [Flavobacteriales bacterium]|nr:T9SS type A sorting domain-containing protein [Flavobacteriales bacterium]